MSNSSLTATEIAMNKTAAYENFRHNMEKFDAPLQVFMNKLFEHILTDIDPQVAAELMGYNGA